MKGVRVQGEVAHLGLGDDDAGFIASLIELGLEAQPGGRAGVPDEFDEGFEGAERTPAPVLRDVAEESVLDLVPLARARWEMRDVDGEAQVVGQALQGGLPAARPIAIAATGIGGDVQRLGHWVRVPSHQGPPLANRGDGEGRRIVIAADADPRFVPRHVVDATRNRFADRIARKIMHPHALWLTRRLPLASAILEIARRGADGDLSTPSRRTMGAGW